MEHQREVNEILIQKSLRTMKGIFYFIFLENSSSEKSEDEEVARASDEIKSDAQILSLKTTKNSHLLVSPLNKSEVVDLKKKIIKARGMPKKKTKENQ